MLDQTSQWYKLQYPECFVNEEQRMMQKVLAVLLAVHHLDLQTKRSCK